MAIEINLTGYCKDCPHFELIAHTLYADWGCENEMTVGCTHEVVCNMWHGMIEKARSEDELETDDYR